MAKKREQISVMTTDENSVETNITSTLTGHPLKVDFGGVGQGREWLTVNVDDTVRAAPDILADITAKAAQLAAFFADASIDAARCIHTLEHFESDQIIPTLHYWRRFMKPGAPLTIVVPDMGALTRDYVSGNIPYEVLASVTYVPGSRIQNRMPEIHKWGFDEALLAWTLTEAGYKKTRPGGDEHWPATWTYDFAELAYTGLFGRYEVPNLRMVADA